MIGCDAAGAIESLCPIAGFHTGDLHDTSRTGGVQEKVITNVYPNVGKLPAQGIEKHQVSRLELGRVDGFPDPADGQRIVWQRHLH